MTDIVWSNVTVTLGQLQPWERNPKSISKSHAKRLLASWDKFGQFQTVAIGPGCEVYDGHQRLSVLRAAYGDGYSVAARQSSRELSDAERRELVIAAHVGTTGQFSWDELSGWDADQLQDWGMDAETLASWRADATALTEMLEAAKEEPPEDPGAQVDKADELREKWGVETGQLWQLGEHRLICGDCTDKAVVERVMGGERADMVFTDPPYGMSLNTDYSGITGSKKSMAGGIKGNKYSEVIGDDVDFDPRPYIAMFPEAKEQLWWGADYYYDKLPPNGSWMVWVKRNENMTDIIGNHFEVCWSMGSHKRRVIYKAWSGVTARNPEFPREHPTEKPIALIGDLINEITDIGDIVVDIFLGSGTTLIACERLNRKCRAVEISPAYVAVAIQRWVDLTGGVPELIQ